MFSIRYVYEGNSLTDPQPQVMSHSADFEYSPLFAILAEFHESLIPQNVTKSLQRFIGEHTLTASTYSPPFDHVPRNITSWLSENITIGAESFDENVLGGPANDQTSFNPVVVQWDTGHGVGFISVSGRASITIASTDWYSSIPLKLP